MWAAVIPSYVSEPDLKTLNERPSKQSVSKFTFSVTFFDRHGSV